MGNGTLWLNMEAVPGSEITETAQEALRLANMLQLTVWFEFHEAKCGIQPNASVDEFVKKFKAQPYSEHRSIVIVGHSKQS